MRVKGAAIDCQRFCCGGKPDCQIVCFNSPAKYAQRLREIRGFELENVPRCNPVKFQRMSGYAPIIHHAYSRVTAFPGEIVALSLYELLDRDGAPKYFSVHDVAKNFRFQPDARIVVSGVHQDRLLERVWQSKHRNAMALMLRSLNVALVTSPNFSVYNNVPRPENLYNIKRVALLSEELLGLGVPTALHVNACTDTDYSRYTEFLAARPEFEAISFEFITGPGYPSRMWWHIKKLLELRNNVGRPLQLILRGGTKAVGQLSSMFAHILVIDSDPLQCALHRRRMIFGNTGHVRIVENKLPKGEPVDDLLIQNAAAAKAEVEFALRNPRLTNRARSGLKKNLTTHNADQKPGQLNLLTDTSLRETRTDAFDSQRVVTAAKS
jgi:hypothetical protein